MRDDAEIAGAPAEDSIEKVRVRAGIDSHRLSVVIYEPDFPNMVAQEAEAAAQLTVSARLSMFANMDTSALAMRDEQVVIFEEAIELSETEAGAAVDKCFVCGLVQDFQVLADLFVCLLHINQNVGT